MSGLTNYAEVYALDYLLATTYVALHTGDPGEDATANVVDVVTDDTAYVRKVVTMGAAATVADISTSANTTAPSWTVNTSSPGYTVTHISLWDAVTAGNPLFKGELLSPETRVADGVYPIAVGLLVAKLD